MLHSLDVVWAVCVSTTAFFQKLHSFLCRHGLVAPSAAISRWIRETGVLSGVGLLPSPFRHTLPERLVPLRCSNFRHLFLTFAQRLPGRLCMPLTNFKHGWCFCIFRCLFWCQGLPGCGLRFVVSPVGDVICVVAYFVRWIIFCFPPLIKAPLWDGSVIKCPSMNVKEKDDFLLRTVKSLPPSSLMDTAPNPLWSYFFFLVLLFEKLVFL